MDAEFIRFYRGTDGEFKYDLQTPYRLIGSASYVLYEIEDVRKQKGFLTADIEYINYKASSYSTNSEGDNSQSPKDYLDKLDDAIDLAYKGAFNFRLGGELKFTTWMVRLGGAYYGNPYNNIAGEKGSLCSCWAAWDIVIKDFLLILLMFTQWVKMFILRIVYKMHLLSGPLSKTQVAMPC